ncbi:MAG TPA: Tex-like N-terminal domain-containing protein [Planctomycetota bacterium]|nr:Tex-like N-terminal domain-containing protein [Planctomycetota bacterium]
MIERSWLERLGAELDLPLASVEGAAALLAEGATVPFLARCRRERIGGLREEELWALATTLRRLQSLDRRRARVLRELETHDALTEAVRDEVAACSSLPALEEVLQRHRGKRRTRGALARERGLEPLAQAILAQTPGAPPLEEMATPYLRPDQGVPDAAAALEGASQIIAEAVADDPAVRNRLYQLFVDTGAVRARVAEGRGNRPSKYEMYYDFSEPVTRIPPHRVLAVRRGEKEGWLRVSVEADRQQALQLLREGRVTAPETPAATIVETAIADAYDRLLAPALEAEFRAELKRRADAGAIHVFARNLRSLLLQPPAGPLRTLGVHPTLRGGCTLAVVDEQGRLLDHATITHKPPRRPAAPGRAQTAPEAKAEAPPEATVEAPPEATVEAPPQAKAEGQQPEPQAEAPPEPKVEAPPEAKAEGQQPGPQADAPPEPKVEEARDILRSLIEKHQVAAVAIGNGAASREADCLVRGVLKEMPGRRALRALVSEAGATSYATSRAARDEFPDLEPPVRAAISIARRFQDPLVELAQGDPKAIGVGQYQHDVNQHALHESLRDVVENCVSLVGVDLNRAPAALLAHVAGVGHAAAREIVRYRAEHGPFRSRAQLKEVPRFTDRQFEQAAGFLRVPGGEQPLDATAIHPERYELVARIAADAGCDVAALLGNSQALEAVDFARYESADAAEPTLGHIRRELLHPGRDPRGAYRAAECHGGVNSLEDLKPGMLLEGRVTNVTAFGAFVDIGLAEDGLVHVSHLARGYVKDPNQVVGVGRVVRVKVLSVDLERRRIALSMRDALPPPRRKPRPEPDRAKRQERTAPARPGPPRPPKEAKPPQEAKPKRDPFAKATPEDIARLIAHFQGR